MLPPEVRIHETSSARILFVADIRGNLSHFNTLANQYNPDFIVHTGNFGFLDNDSVSRIHESYLRHIVEFSPLLPQHLILKISQLSKVSGDSVHHLSNDNVNLKNLLLNQNISQLTKFLSGELKLNIPVYTIYGMCEDSNVINKFRYGIYKIPNLNIIDDSTIHLVKLPKDQSILLSGIGGSLSYHKLFHQGTSHNFNDLLLDSKITPYSDLLPISGDPGNIWITILQIGKFIQSLFNFAESNPSQYNNSIKFFITHQSPTREPLLEHLSIFFKMDYTISNSLHFKYISSYNSLTVNPSFESFKLKFADSRMKLSKIWAKVQKKYERLLIQIPNDQIARYVDLALTVYDKIPISTKATSTNQSFSTSNSTSTSNSSTPLFPNDDIPSLSLSSSLLQSLQSSEIQDVNENLNKHEVNLVIRHLNDLYYVAFQHSWHYNICDVSHGQLILNFDDGKVSMEATSNGFDFNYRKENTAM
ncbi:hypothetical protein C6P40_000255 [Pichia californica]|uniref:DUF2433 domain-containing protein n=1 Tax=Pichia californica TaxID=460514 RepID=A0A9P7BFJ2_9ASCO|nr:hypothetical protein C6P42_000375 [[Candida] californica]KAG0688996.1 hypothetical protein C6P40_000255 [[Candida] californica]